jgi:hypothetical protein
VADPAEQQVLICAECGQESNDSARGWRASFLSSDDELPLRDDKLETWCPACAAREFDAE